MNNQAAQTMPALPRPYWKAGEVRDDFGNPYNETDLFTDDDMRAMYRQGYAAALSQTAGVPDDMAAKRENIAQRARNMLADQFMDDPVMAEKIRAGTCRNEDLNRAVKAVELAITLKKPHPTKALQAVLGEMDER